MTNYETGVVYVWQNQVNEYAHLNGRECVVTGPVDFHMDWNGKFPPGWPTDTPDFIWPYDAIIYAQAGDLRRKQPPAGEESVLRMFTAPAPRELEPA